VGGIALMAFAVWQRPAGTDDFRAFYRAAVLASQHRNVYADPSSDPDKNSAGTFLPYIRIPSYALMLRPLATLPYAAARRVWIAAALLAFLACVWIFPDGRNRIATALAFSFPVACTLVLGQDTGFVLLIALASARIFAAGRDFAAGLAASLIAIKITYLPAAGLVFLAKSRRGTLGFLTGVAVQLAVSFGVAGAGWPRRYLAVLGNPLLDSEPRRMLSVRAVAAGLALPPVVYVAAALALYLGLWVASRRLSLPDALSLALAVGVIASPHCYIYDAAMLIPLLVRVASPGSRAGLTALIGLTPLPYLALMTDTPELVLAGAAAVIAAVIAAGWGVYRIGDPPVTACSAVTGNFRRIGDNVI
jgi:hypothetical protein